MEKFKYIVTSIDEGLGCNIYDLIRENFTFSSRLKTKLRQNKAFYLNGEKSEGWIKPKAGDVISIMLPDECSDFPAEDIEINPVYEDDDLLIINKQPGYVVHPTKGQPCHTIANGLMKYMADTNQSFKIRFVNRLDRDTSGLLIIAKNSFTQEELTKQMKQNLVQKKYKALLCGIIKEDNGTVDLPIGRPDENRIERGILPIENGGYESVTHYSVIKRFYKPMVRLHRELTVDHGFKEGLPLPFDLEQKESLINNDLAYDIEGYTLCELTLETGRTHQIRVHMGSKDNFVVGDSLYGGVLYENKGDMIYSPITKRQLLHAYYLTFIHPITKEKMCVEAKLPEDIEALCK